jgi:DNA replication protein DnaC
MVSTPPVSPRARWARRAEEERAWSAANSELALAWDQALEEDETRAGEKLRARSERELLLSINTVLPRMGVPIRTAEAVKHGCLSGFDERPAIATAREWVSGKKSMMLLYGGCGAGKTLAAAWTLLRSREVRGYTEHEVALDARGGRFIRACELTRLGQFDGDWEHVLHVKWLVLDDFGTELNTPAFMARLNELIDHRYGNHLRTAITCNIRKDQLAAHLGPRIVSRMRDDGLVVGCGDDDMRIAAR